MFNLIIGPLALGLGYLIITTCAEKGKKKILGTSYVADKEELKKHLGKDGVRLSKNITLSLKSSYDHVGIFGKTGAFKSTSFFIPNALSDEIPKKSSLILSDMSGELYELTSWYQEHICGRKVIIFDPLNPQYSSCYNPLEVCRDVIDVKKVAQSLVANAALTFQTNNKSSSGAEWDSMATPLLTAALLYCRYKGGSMNNISTALDVVIKHSDYELEILFKDTTSQIEDYWSLYKTCLKAESTAASIRITLACALQSFLDYKIAIVTSKCDFRPEDLRKTPIALYIKYSEMSADYLSPVMAVIFNQIINMNLEYYDKHKNNSLPIINFYDEFANLGFLPGFNHTITAARKREFSLNLCIHDMCQLYRIYGKELTHTMLNNLSTKVVLPGISETTTLEYISKITGKTQLTIENKSETEERTTHSYSEQTKELFTTAETRCLKDKTCLIINDNNNAVIDDLNIYFENDIYKDRVKKQYL